MANVRRPLPVTEKQTDKQTDRQTDRQTDKQTETQTDRQTDRQTERQIVLHTHKQTHTYRERRTHTHTHTHTQVLPEATHVLGDQFQQWCAVLLIVVWCVPRQQANGEAGPG